MVILKGPPGHKLEAETSTKILADKTESRAQRWIKRIEVNPLEIECFRVDWQK